MTSTTIVSPTAMSLNDIMNELKTENNVVIVKELADDQDIKVGENLSVKISLGTTYANLSALLAGDNFNAHEDTYIINMSVIAIVSNMQGFASLDLLGGASSGVSYNIFIADTAEEILEKLSANTDFRVTGTITAPGRPKGARIRKRFRGMYLGLRLWNLTAGEVWSINKIIGMVKQGGRFK